ncbi:helix-turn-helix domain-containing protein [Gluconobacter sp. R75690]|uniref:helix-turn-helix domain-containing protein n=1 Tax=Gluconobacter TaxID=441 RepID=UPI00188C6490|nr:MULTISPECIES: helix-turn-helix domain-containing protein [unclassified Gluconobacter]MBF0850958.1 helix-turn-helix domain-containing protein [Gluconobacter sp. R75690]MBF0879650.1 helix-turn-helix domain-containing protein [Gluconobacter sp. R75828]
MTSREAAEYLRISYDGFRTMRSRGQGPAVFIALGRRLRFRKHNLDAFLASRVQCDARVSDLSQVEGVSTGSDQKSALKRKRGRPRSTGQIVLMPVSFYVKAGLLLALAIAGCMISLLFS